MGPTERDRLIMTIELTLISIIQGVALFFLTDNSREVIIERQYLFWPYVLTGLVIIFLFWSRSIIHTLTVIRWPLEFGHNFLYITCTLIQAVTFTQVSHPIRWFAMNVVFSFSIWLLFVWDLRMIRLRSQERADPSHRELYEIVKKDQLRNIWFLMPTTVFFNALSAWLIKTRADFFINQNGHVVIAGLQFLSAFGYLWFGVRFFRRISGLIKNESV